MPIDVRSSGHAESELDFTVLVEAAVEMVRKVAYSSADYSLFMVLFASEFRATYDALSHHDTVPMYGPNIDLIGAIMANVVKRTRSQQRSCRVFGMMAERFDEISRKQPRVRSHLGVPGDVPTNPRTKT